MDAASVLYFLRKGFLCLRGEQEVYKNPPQRSAPVSYSLHFQLKGNRQFLRKLTHGECQNLTDCDFCKDIRSAQIAVCQFYDLSSSDRKVKTNFSPLIVVVCIPMYCFVLVCSGGDFFVFVGQLQLPHTENTGLQQKSRHLFYHSFVKTLCAAGAAILVVG